MGGYKSFSNFEHELLFTFQVHANMRLRFVAFWYLLAVFEVCFGKSTPDSLLRQFVTNIENFNRSFPQEKVYLHLDNTGYFAGETIWYKAYVFRDDSQRATDLSGVLYVELINPMGEVVQTHKHEIVNGGADGHINLEGLLNSGFYEIRAYTRYMVNWGNAGMFSRILPILNAPDVDGDWSQRTMDVFSYERRLPDNREKEHEGEKRMNVAFYPEGGHFVNGLENRMAFSVTNRDGAHFETSGYLESGGQKICDVATIREGRGVFSCVPSGSKLTLHLQNENGKDCSFDLPKAEAMGCVLTISESSDSALSVKVSGNGIYENTELGLLVLNHGNILSFKTIICGKAGYSEVISKNNISEGVHQISLIDAEGNVLAERLVFSFPRKAPSPINVTLENEILSQYCRISLRAKTEPGASFSLAVRDYGSQFNGWQQNGNSWKLLASDLKGYIENPDYYFECDDEEHRRAADLLMMVQGWRRYNLSQMMGREDFTISQKMERTMYVEGRIYDERKNVKKKIENPDVYLTVMNKNTSEGSAGGLFGSKDGGYFFIPLSRFYGTRDFIFRPDEDGDISQFAMSFNRWFSPPTRHVFKNETFSLPVDTPRVWLGWKDDTTAIAMSQREYMLDMVEVKGKRNRDPRAAWLNEKKGERYASIYYDCQLFNEQIRDRHEKSPDFLKWLKKKNNFFGGNWGNEYFDENGRFVEQRLQVMKRDGMDYKRRPVIWIINNGFYCLSFAPKKLSDKDIVRSMATWEDFPATLDEVRSVYISEDENAWQSTLQMPSLIPHRPVTVFIYKSSQGNEWERRRKGIRSFSMSGFDKIETFKSPNYQILPSLPDHRRTLYWNPNVKTDEKGEVDIVFYNNLDCRQLVISAEGFTKEGLPIVY